MCVCTQILSISNESLCNFLTFVFRPQLLLLHANYTTSSRCYVWYVGTISSNNFSAFQVHIRGQFTSKSVASEVLAIDDLSFGPDCVNTTGNAASITSRYTER